MAKKTTVQYLITGTVDAPIDDVLTRFDPQVIEEYTLLFRNLFGQEIQIIVEDVEIVDAEEIA